VGVFVFFDEVHMWTDAVVNVGENWHDACQNAAVVQGGVRPGGCLFCS